MPRKPYAVRHGHAGRRLVAVDYMQARGGSTNSSFLCTKSASIPAVARAQAARINNLVVRANTTH